MFSGPTDFWFIRSSRTQRFPGPGAALCRGEVKVALAGVSHAKLGRRGVSRWGKEVFFHAGLAQEGSREPFSAIRVSPASP